MPVRGPRLRIVRRFGTQLPGLTRKDATKRPNPPGQHGPSTRRKKTSEYRRLLLEKQKVRFNYGVTERQLRNILAIASRRAGRTGDNVLTLLESRLDNIVFRLGFAATIPAARQLVSHGHVRVNGRRLDRPSAQLRSGDIVTLSPGARNIPAVVAQAEKGPEVRLPSFLALDLDDKFAGRVLSEPMASDVPFEINANSIVEYYAR
ncbi:MAG TPA: 30S ribosomal protein S4 [Gemmatimonadales bacterium]|nr:30S ribosomal protein S4 [Gemmatimonadales bacterium]